MSVLQFHGNLFPPRNHVLHILKWPSDLNLWLHSIQLAFFATGLQLQRPYHFSSVYETTYRSPHTTRFNDCRPVQWYWSCIFLIELLIWRVINENLTQGGRCGGSAGGWVGWSECEVSRWRSCSWIGDRSAHTFIVLSVVSDTPTSSVTAINNAEMKIDVSYPAIQGPESTHHVVTCVSEPCRLKRIQRWCNLIDRF